MTSGPALCKSIHSFVGLYIILFRFIIVFIYVHLWNCMPCVCVGMEAMRGCGIPLELELQTCFEVPDKGVGMNLVLRKVNKNT